MKPIALLTALLLGGIATAPLMAQGSPLPPPGKIEHIKGNLYKIFGGGGNTLVFVQKDGVVLIDTKMPGNGEAILEQVRAVTDKPVTTIINSHGHPDHIGSTDYIREKFPNVRVIAHENAKRSIEANPMYKPAVYPGVTYADRMTVGQGDDRIELYYFGPAHTDGDALLVFPAVKTMFYGDVMAWDMAPLIDPGTGGTVIGLPDALEKAASTIKDIDIVVEGHGAVNNWQNFLRFTAFNRALLKAAQEAYARGDVPGAAIAALQKNPSFAPLLDTNIKPGLEYGNTPLARAHMNVNVAFQQLSGEPVTTNFGAPLPATEKHKASDPQATAAPARPAGN